MKRRAKKMITGLVSLWLITIAGLFLGRDALLRRTADKELNRLEQKWKLQINYEELKFSSLSEIALSGFTVVPLERDTLLRLEQLRLKLDLFSLLGKNLSVRNVYVDGLKATFVKCRGISNYDFLFGTQGTPAVSGGQSHQTDYSAEVKRLVNMLFGVLPNNGELNRICISGQRDSLVTSFLIPALRIADSRFSGEIQVAEGSQQACWEASGQMASNERRLQMRLAGCNSSDRVFLPYIGPHYLAAVAFDSIAFSLEKAEKAGRQLLRGKASVAGLEVFHRGLSPDTILLDRGQLDYLLQVGTQEIVLDSSSTVTFNQLQFHPYVRASREGKWHVTASIHKEPFPSSQLFESLPAGLFPHVQGVRTSGELSYRLQLDIDWNCLDSLRFSSDLVSHGFRILDDGNARLARMNDTFEYTAYERDVPVRTFDIGSSNPNFRTLSQISPILQMAVLQSEDGGFFYHQGFLPGAIQEALAYDLQVGRFARGGSTISMQLVKNIFLNRHKNIARKLEEALLVWLIENQRITSKDRMFEVYLNIIEWAPLIYGAAEASHFYFAKEPSELTVNEAIFLASLIPKPKHFRSVFNPDATLKENQAGYFQLLAKRLQVKGIITEEQEAAVAPVIEVKGPAREFLLQTDTVTARIDSLTEESRLPSEEESLDF